MEVLKGRCLDIPVAFISIATHDAFDALLALTLELDPFRPVTNHSLCRAGCWAIGYVSQAHEPLL